MIVPPDAPIVALLASESVLGVENARWSSAGGASYPTSVLMLRPGDKISLPYGNTRIPNTKETLEFVPQVEPVIHMLPFAIDAKAYYNAWIIEHVAP